MTTTTIGISLRALFNLEDANQQFLEKGAAAYNDYLISTADRPFRPGPAMRLIQALCFLNHYAPNSIRLVILSRSSPHALPRLVKSLEHYNLAGSDGASRTECGLVLASGGNRFEYAQALKTDLFLSNHSPDVTAAIQRGFAAALLTAQHETEYRAYTQPEIHHLFESNRPPNIVFDGDAVLFDGEADAVYRRDGMDAFTKHVHKNRHAPMQDGPFAAFFRKLHALKEQFAQAGHPQPFHLQLLTARGGPACMQVLTTLQQWGMMPDSLIAAAGAPKGPILQAGNAAILFDDTPKNLASAADHDILGAHVPYGAGGITPTL